MSLKGWETLFKYNIFNFLLTYLEVFFEFLTFLNKKNNILKKFPRLATFTLFFQFVSCLLLLKIIFYCNSTSVLIIAFPNYSRLISCSSFCCLSTNTSHKISLKSYNFLTFYYNLLTLHVKMREKFNFIVIICLFSLSLLYTYSLTVRLPVTWCSTAQG